MVIIFYTFGTLRAVPGHEINGQKFGDRGQKLAQRAKHRHNYEHLGHARSFSHQVPAFNSNNPTHTRWQERSIHSIYTPAMEKGLRKSDTTPFDQSTCFGMFL